MDLPWNPAVLEQRVGRVHRLGQARPVRVVNFVAQGTIEEGMLSVLKFKRSLFAGVLDGGEKDVFLGGSRLNKFMESVERATSSIPPQEMLDDAAEALHRPPMEGDEEEPRSTTRRRGRPGRAGGQGTVPVGAGAPARGRDAGTRGGRPVVRIVASRYGPAATICGGRRQCRERKGRPSATGRRVAGGGARRAHRRVVLKGAAAETRGAGERTEGGGGAA